MKVNTINTTNNINNRFSTDNRNDLSKTNKFLYNDINFKKSGKDASKLTELIANTYGKFILNNKALRKFSKWLANADKNDATRHFQVAGSLVTSSAYMMATLKNKDIEKKNGRTLAINQGLGFIVPTVAGYTVDTLLRGFNKILEYAYSGSNEKKIALGNMTKEESNAALATLSKRLRGFRTCMSIITFTMIYRYLAPVAITPAANKLGNWLNDWIDKKEGNKESLKK